MIQNKKPINILFFGPSGSGKGTQAEMLAKKYNLQRLQSGAILRKWAIEKTEFGKKVQAAMNEGFVPSEWIFQMTEEEFSKVDENQGLMLENFSRMLPEIKNLYKVLSNLDRKLDYIFLIDIGDEEAIKRMLSRGTCEKCEKVVVLGEGVDKLVCPDCSGMIRRRKDENIESINKRLKDYHSKTSEVLDYVRNNDKLIEINGNQSIDNVFHDIISYIKVDK
ncbi:MAG: nucleoside monophosphate kinase [Candidatus Pacebacteria bacterium]|nr:nucleoside monophosphate kinase [Candidatus Paceibacterota bacterium]